MRVTRNFMSAMLGLGNRNTSSRSRMSSRLPATTRANRFLNTQATNKANGTQSTYQNMKNNAGELQNSASKLIDTGTDSVFAKAQQSGNTAGVTRQIKDFVSKYNSTVRSLKSGGSRLDNSYLNQLNANATMYRSALRSSGVTKNSDGTLSIDEKALNSASLEQLQKAWNGSGSFAAKTSSAAVNVQSNAVSNLNNMVNNSYSNLLRGYGSRGNYFNFWS